jgi:hypothetical protein
MTDRGGPQLSTGKSVNPALEAGLWEPAGAVPTWVRSGGVTSESKIKIQGKIKIQWRMQMEFPPLAKDAKDGAPTVCWRQQIA